eukprot:GEMP01018584.1.p1 GENE.GEMP01018584.1~~GEMP01018584.1.p1  ORF type:complete len:289 (+),score=83.17 GEMP01018584.1:106-972(+)
MVWMELVGDLLKDPDALAQNLQLMNHAKGVIEKLDSSQIAHMLDMASMVSKVDPDMLKIFAGLIPGAAGGMKLLNSATGADANRELPNAHEMDEAKSRMVGLNKDGLAALTTIWPFNQILPILHFVEMAFGAASKLLTNDPSHDAPVTASESDAATPADTSAKTGGVAGMDATQVGHMMDIASSLVKLGPGVMALAGMFGASNASENKDASVSSANAPVSSANAPYGAPADKPEKPAFRRAPSHEELKQAKQQMEGMDLNKLAEAAGQWPFNQILPAMALMTKKSVTK